MRRRRRRYIAFRFMLMLILTSSTYIFCAIEVILLGIQFISLLTFISREYAFYGISISVDFAFIFIALFIYLLFVAVGLNSPEVSSTLIAGAGTLLKTHPQKFMHAVNDVQKTMQCCGFAGNYTEWMQNRTVQYYDPIEGELKVMLKGQAKNIWQPLNEEERKNLAPLSCCPNSKKHCTRKRIYQPGCFKKFSTNIAWLMHSISLSLLVHLVFSVLQEVIFTYVAVDITITSSSTESSRLHSIDEKGLKKSDGIMNRRKKSRGKKRHFKKHLRFSKRKKKSKNNKHSP